MSEELEVDSGNSRRRRRRRRRKRGAAGNGGGGGGHDRGTVVYGDEVITETTTQRRGGRRAVDLTGPVVAVPATGRNPARKRNSRARRGAPGSAGARRRRISREELDAAAAWLQRMPDSLISNLYKGLGGQPGRVGTKDRMIQLAVRALGQPSRIDNLLRQLQERDKKALSALVQAGGVAHGDEFVRELSLSFGGHEREWKRVLSALADKGLVFASDERDGDFFYILPMPIVDGLIEALEPELSLPLFVHDDVRVIDVKPFCPPLDYSIASLATYIDQNSPRLTQRHEIYRHDKEAMDEFFSQIWESDSELFAFHIDFLMMHGLVELRGEYLSLNRDATEEWLNLEPEDQRDLVFRALEKRFDMAEWVMWAVHNAAASSDEEGWVAENPLVAQYRRWRKGADWRERYQRGTYAATRSHERESYSFAPLVRAGMLEMGQWGQEKFYRLSPRGRALLSPAEDDGFRQFYLTPSFEIMAPAGLAPILLFRIGELGELVGCDRANTYKITEPSIERGLDRGWRRDDVLQFLRENSQIGLPENVESTLKGWIGHRGDVEFHEVTLMTVHRSQIRRLEGNKKIKPYLLHRFAPGMYAVDASRRAEIEGVLRDLNFDPTPDTRRYPGDPEAVEARQNLHRLVREAREASVDPLKRGLEAVEPEALHAVPGTRVAKRKKAKEDKPPLVDAAEARQILERAMSEETDVEMVYKTQNAQKLTCLVEPQRVAFKGDQVVLVGLDRESGERRTYHLERIERLRIVEA
ncbi:MAG: WYL domain-containing protein [Deltaproteobacteria bacterium]|nr:MAG: WYL domain-containing protein [Deltaproteobacteria bacterium]